MSLPPQIDYRANPSHGHTDPPQERPSYDNPNPAGHHFIAPPNNDLNDPDNSPIYTELQPPKVKGWSPNTPPGTGGLG